MQFKSIPSSTVMGAFATFVLIVAVTVAPSFGLAQEDSVQSSDFSLHVGSLLPNQIDGVTEILPVFGGRYGWSLGGVVLELGGSNSHAKGVDYTMITLSLRGEIPAAEGISGVVYGGVDESWYRPIDEGERKTETGVHVGGGVMLHIADTLWLRSDLKFTGGPGTSLYLGFGLAFRGGAASDN